MSTGESPYYAVLTRRRATRRVVPVVLALLSSAACAAATQPLGVESATMTAQVITALVNDPDVGARPIDVRVTGGVVTLSGRVLTLDEEQRAIALARAVPGITRVDSRLRIGDAPPPDGDQPPPTRSRVPRDPAVEFRELQPSGGRLAVGAALVSSQPTDDAFESASSLGPLLRIGSGAGLAPALGLDWFRATLTPAGPALASSRLAVRPLMLGLGYTLVLGRVSVAPSIVGGYAFNSIAVPETGASGRLAVSVRNSLAWRPGVSVWIDTGRRTSLNLSVGRVMTRVRVTFIDDGRIDQQELAAHSTLMSVGLAYRVF